MTARGLLDELRGAGITVTAAIDLDGPSTALTGDRIAQARRLKPQMLRLLLDEPNGAASADADQFPSPREIQYTAQERDLMADAPKEMRPRVDAVKSQFADLGGATVADVRNESLRHKAASLIRAARRAGNPDLAVDLRDRWHERVAICVVDGGLSEKDAERVALKELRGRLTIHGVKVVAPLRKGSDRE